MPIYNLCTVMKYLLAGSGRDDILFSVFFKVV